jgi:GNAT superfamily N-acetyltransferase
MTAPAVVRDATRDDLEHIIAMLADDPLGLHRETVTSPPAPAYIAAFDAIEADPRTRLLVLEWEGRVAGTLQLTFLPGLNRRGMERAQIEGVRVDSTIRGHGLGHQLVSAAVELARERGCGLVQLTTDLQRHDAFRFYESLGFQHTHAGMKLSLEAE